jgi:hypothetical protein
MSIVDAPGEPTPPANLLTLTQNSNIDEDYLVINPNMPSHIGTFHFGIQYDTTCLDHNKAGNDWGG